MRVYRMVKQQHRFKAGSDNVVLMIVTDDSVSPDAVEAAWSYAVRYSAKGLDVPDYEAAAKLMLSRHPAWRVENVVMTDVSYNGNVAENDNPD